MPRRYRPPTSNQGRVGRALVRRGLAAAPGSVALRRLAEIRLLRVDHDKVAVLGREGLKACEG